MRLAGIEITPRHQRIASRAMQVAIALILIVGLVTRNASVVVNAALALAATFLPALLARDYRIPLDAGLTLWITTALFLHTIGMLGLYDDVWWWDHVTHTLSATIVAAVGYVTARAIDVHRDDIYLPPRFLGVFILIFTLAFGVFWEVLEFASRIASAALGLDPVLVQYGLDDSLLDLVFDTVGAVLVAAFGTGAVSEVVDALVARLDSIGGPRGRSIRSARSAPAANGDPLDGLIEHDRTNARRSWIVLAVIGLVTIERAVAADLLWVAFGVAVAGLALVPALAYRTPEVMLPWGLLALAGLPLIGRVFAEGPLSNAFVTALSFAGLALIVAAELDAFTPVEMTPTFAVVVVVMTTTAAAGVWAVGSWVSDLWLGTEFLLVPGVSASRIETEMLWGFVYATAAGIIAGVLFEFGFRRRERADDRRSAGRRTAPEGDS
ncbi:hypothetical protein [Halococcus saccharolyticus]|uniref:Uncharacterized protein n=1 Tax=Halococcus saccharolyticus DSM 5350 TaxID=1227455 RepID=M0MP80_9EURY|nr:hypothetical protein C449_04560 [Halococcus saccharolyticus DSM 5350]